MPPLARPVPASPLPRRSPPRLMQSMSADPLFSARKQAHLPAGVRSMRTNPGGTGSPCLSSTSTTEVTGAALPPERRTQRCKGWSARENACSCALRLSAVAQPLIPSGTGSFGPTSTTSVTGRRAPPAGGPAPPGRHFPGLAEQPRPRLGQPLDEDRDAHTPDMLAAADMDTPNDKYWLTVSARGVGWGGSACSRA